MNGSRMFQILNVYPEKNFEALFGVVGSAIFVPVEIGCFTWLQETLRVEQTENRFLVWNTQENFT